MEAQVVKGLLESHGIPCLLQSNNMPSPFGINMSSVNVMVWGSMAEEARELIGRSEDG
jgi:hypothetical protein